jgi:hypothetical protein
MQAVAGALDAPRAAEAAALLSRALALRERLRRCRERHRAHEGALDVVRH